MTKPIYTAPPIERLYSLSDQALRCAMLLEMEGAARPTLFAEGESVGLKPGEFAVGDWLVRPRFTDDEDLLL